MPATSKLTDWKIQTTCESQAPQHIHRPNAATPTQSGATHRPYAATPAGELMQPCAAHYWTDHPVSPPRTCNCHTHCSESLNSAYTQLPNALLHVTHYSCAYVYARTHCPLHSVGVVISPAVLIAFHGCTVNHSRRCLFRRPQF